MLLLHSDLPQTLSLEDIRVLNTKYVHTLIQSPVRLGVRPRLL